MPDVRRAAVVNGSDGLDEVSLDGPTRVLVVESGMVRRLSWLPADFGLDRQGAADLRVSGPEDSADRIRRTLAGEPGAVRDYLLANAAAALWVIEPSPLRDAVERATAAIDSGAAARLLDRWAAFRT
jgi:anthranilate phosphoribosyltransferase